MVRGVRVETRRAHKAGFTAATAADTLLGVQADAKTQWHRGKPTTLHIRRLVMVMPLERPVQHLRAQRQGVDLLQGVILSTEHLGQIGPRPRTGNQMPDPMQGLTRWASGDRLPNAAGRRRYNGASHAPYGRNVHSRPLDPCGDPAPASHPRVPRPLFVSRARGLGHDSGCSQERRLTRAACTVTQMLKGSRRPRMI